MVRSNEQLQLDPGELFRTLGQIRKEAKPLEPLWGYLLYRKAITSIVGDPGLSKTTLAYTMTSCLCEGKPFLGIHPELPINAIYMDLESQDSLVVSRANLIMSKVYDIPNMFIYNMVDYFITNIGHVLIDFCHKENINLIVIDNQSLAFNTRNENDNAEAIKQMKYLRWLTTSCNCATVLIHHTSKADLKDTRKGSGAYARARLADICINVNSPSQDNKDLIQFEVVKNRMVDDKMLLYLEKNKGAFNIVDPPTKEYRQPTTTLVFKAQQDIINLFNEYSQELKAKYIKEQMNIAGHDKHTVANALFRLTQQGILIKPRYGLYTKTTPNN